MHYLGLTVSRLYSTNFGLIDDGHINDGICSPPGQGHTRSRSFVAVRKLSASSVAIRPPGFARCRPGGAQNGRSARLTAAPIRRRQKIAQRTTALKAVPFL